MQRKIQYYWNQCQEHSPTPLTYVEDNQDGMTCTSCPSHLINGRQITSMPNGGHFQSCYHKCIQGTTIIFFITLQPSGEKYTC